MSIVENRDYSTRAKSSRSRLAPRLYSRQSRRLERDAMEEQYMMSQPHDTSTVDALLVEGAHVISELHVFKNKYTKPA